MQLTAGPMTTDALADRLGITCQAAHAASVRAMEAGYIRRVGKDGRAILLGLA